MDQTHRTILTMALVQALKDLGIAAIPNPLRNRLNRLRKTTGLPLDTTLL